MPHYHEISDALDQRDAHRDLCAAAMDWHPDTLRRVMAWGEAQERRRKHHARLSPGYTFAGGERARQRVRDVLALAGVAEHDFPDSLRTAEAMPYDPEAQA